VAAPCFRRTCLAAATLVAVAAAFAFGTEGLDASLSSDPQGWALSPVIAASADGRLYAAWSAHRNPAQWEFADIYVKRWTGNGWEGLGGRVGHSIGQTGGVWTEAYAPSLAAVAGIPYLAWYEGGGYGWGKVGETAISASVFVAHWDGRQWALDRSPAMPNGSLNTGPDASGRTPKLATVNGVLHVAWIESRFVPNAGTHNVVVVRRLVDARWMPAGQEFRGAPTDGYSQIIDLAIVDAGGVAHVAWTESADLPRRSSVRVARLDGNQWVPLGRPLNAVTDGAANHLALAALGKSIHVVWQERPPAGHYQVYGRTWSGSRWSSAAGSLNVDPARGEAGRPALVADASRLWLAWTEGAPGQPAGLYVRSLETGGWSSAQGPLNADPAHGAPDGPSLADLQGRLFLIWAEKGPPPATKQIYVRPLK